MASWKNGKLTEWLVDKMPSWQKCQVEKNVKLMKWKVDQMVSWPNGMLINCEFDQMLSW